MGKYTICFEGRINKNTLKQKAIQSIAKTFNVRENEVEAIFDGNGFFIKKDLNQIALKAYLTAFEDADAIVNVYKQDKADLVFIRCPKCSHLQLVTETCEECGIIINKFINVQQQLIQKKIESKHVKDETVDFKNEVYSGTEVKIKKHVMIGAIILTTLFFLDNLLQAGQYDISIYWYFIANLSFSPGCFYYLKNKRYPLPFNIILSALGLIGLCVAFILPTRGENSRLLYQMLTLACVIGSAVYLPYTYVKGNTELEKFIAEGSSQINNVLSTYPDTQLAQNPIDTILSENQKVIDYMIKGIEILNDYDYRPATKQKATRHLFLKIADHERLMNYQFYLYQLNCTNLDNCEQYESFVKTIEKCKQEICRNYCEHLYKLTKEAKIVEYLENEYDFRCVAGNFNIFKKYSYFSVKNDKKKLEMIEWWKIVLKEYQQRIDSIYWNTRKRDGTIVKPGPRKFMKSVNAKNNNTLYEIKFENSQTFVFVYINDDSESRLFLPVGGDMYFF